MNDKKFRISECDYDFSGDLPRVNGELLRSNTSIAANIISLLESVGYKFGTTHPLPAIIKNYNSVNRKDLVYLFYVLCNQIDTFPKSVYDFLTVTAHGFSISFYDDVYPERICKCVFKLDNKETVRYLTLSEVPTAVKRFLCSIGFKKSVIIY